MAGDAEVDVVFIGWDVGGWNCEKNSASRDSIVILDAALRVIGRPWRGNLRDSINRANTTGEWMASLFSLCKAGAPRDPLRATMAIDAPLGFSEEFVALVTTLTHADSSGKSGDNRYLFRRTERMLFQKGLTPLSAIKDMIGSQATKGMHALARFAPHVESCGVWTDGKSLRAIEAYPAACEGRGTIARLKLGFEPFGHKDENDALTCALVAFLFAERRAELWGPDENVSASEGWIWVPKDAFAPLSSGDQAL